MDINEAYSAVHNLVSGFEGLVTIRDALKAALDAEAAQHAAEVERDTAVKDLARLTESIAVEQQKLAKIEDIHAARMTEMETEIKALMDAKEKTLSALDARIETARLAVNEIESVNTARLQKLDADFDSRKSALDDEIALLTRTRATIKREISQAGASLSS